eukprot:gene21814-28232_t
MRNPTSQPSRQPVRRQPSQMPSRQPSRQPLRMPTLQPFDSNPVPLPTYEPSFQPSKTPSKQPTIVPTTPPTSRPSLQGTCNPSVQPSSPPSHQPSIQPTVIPTYNPTLQPLNLHPTIYPSLQPIWKPSHYPTTKPSFQPSRQPVRRPTNQPTKQPRRSPTSQPLLKFPSRQPSNNPSIQPSRKPTLQRTFPPTNNPSMQPICFPVSSPTVQPSTIPTMLPTRIPSATPSLNPSRAPTCYPNALPYSFPTLQPSKLPTALPSCQPLMQPTLSPKCKPSIQPVKVPSYQPFSWPSVQPKGNPTKVPSGSPTRKPSCMPSSLPRRKPTFKPISFPSSLPSIQPLQYCPSSQPQGFPSSLPSILPSQSPSKMPVVGPTNAPLASPSKKPTLQSSLKPSVCPTCQPTRVPSHYPSLIPSHQTSRQPTAHPIISPTFQPYQDAPTNQPVQIPSVQPSSMPSFPSRQPTRSPSDQPIALPTSRPTSCPVRIPSTQPTQQPSIQLVARPSEAPSAKPHRRPTCNPSMQPSIQPSHQLNASPSTNPQSKPSHIPTSQPYRHPSYTPTFQPNSKPSLQPSSRPSSSCPTARPSSIPTEHPVTPTPTRLGDKCSPVRPPSSSPSAVLDYIERPIFQDYLKVKYNFSAHLQTVSFSSFSYKSVTIDGQCKDWKYYSRNSLSLPLPTIYFSKFSYFFKTVDLESNVVTMVYGQCNDHQIVAKIAEAMQTNTNYIAKCGQRDILRVISCRGNMIVCVNCKANCPSSSLCPGNALVINACQQCTRANTAVSGASIIGFKIATVYLNPSILSLSVVSSSTSSITVAVKISKPGVIHCASFLPGKKITSVLEIKMFGSQVLLTNSTVSNNATMTGLSADTVYNVFCCAEDFSGNIMNVNETLRHTVATRTACCRTINLLSSLSHIEPIGSANTDDQMTQISFSLNSYPTKVSFITVTISTAMCNAATIVIPSTNTTTLSSSVKIFPRTFVLYPNSSSLTATFMIRSITTGCYLLSISSRGSDKYKSVNNFFYCQSYEQPSVPRLHSVQLSSDGTNLLFLFDSDTNQGEKYITSELYAFDCHKLVFFPGSTNSSCVWVSYSQLSAIITSSSIVNVGDNAGIFGSRITAKCRLADDCSSYSYCAQSIVRILAPTVSIRPTVYLSSSSGVQLNCNTVILDASQSTGAGVRDWKSIEWTVVVTDSMNSILVPGIANYLNQFSKLNGIRIPITVPPALFGVVNAQLTFTLHLENFLMQSGYASVVTVISNSSKITASVRLVTPNTGIYAGSLIKCIAIPAFPKCLSNTQVGTLTFNWQVFEGLTEIQGLSSTDPNPRVFSLTPYSLVAGKVFIIKVSMFSTTSAAFSTSSSVVQVMIAGVVAVIQGGLSQRIAATEPLFLDGSNSFDKDSSASSESLVYRWSCKVQYPVFGSPCGNFITSKSSILYIPPSAFSPGAYNITLLVRNPVLGTAATTTCQVVVMSLTLPVPQVSINSIVSKRNPNLPVVITGTINSNSIYGLVNATWISSIGSRRLSSIATTPTATIISTMNTELQLGLDIQSLSVGLSYLFTLQASYLSKANVQSSSSIVLSINSPPRNGQLVMSPASGIALTTIFSFSTSSWTDDPTDYPLQYVLGFFISDPSEFTTVKSLNMISYAEAYVSPGLSSSNYAVFCVTQAVDNFGAVSNISTQITVQPIDDSAVIVSTLASALSAAYAAYDPAAVIGTISAAAG